MTVNELIWSKFPNFQPSEFKCSCGCCTEVPDMSEDLLWVLQAVRNKFGTTTITSGYRCKKKNDSTPGASKTSKHMYKKAADIVIKGKQDTLAKRKEIMQYIVTLPNVDMVYCNGCMMYPNGTSKSYTAPGMVNSIHIQVK